MWLPLPRPFEGYLYVLNSCSAVVILLYCAVHVQYSACPRVAGNEKGAFTMLQPHTVSPTGITLFRLRTACAIGTDASACPLSCVLLVKQHYSVEQYLDTTTTKVKEAGDSTHRLWTLR